MSDESARVVLVLTAEMLKEFLLAAAAPVMLAKLVTVTDWFTR